MVLFENLTKSEQSLTKPEYTTIIQNLATTIVLQSCKI